MTPLEKDQTQDLETLLRELADLRAELAELRATDAIHRQAQQGLEAIELQLAGIIHSAMDGIITVDEEQKVVLFNLAAERLFGCSANQALGKSIDRFIPERFRKDHRKDIQKFGERNVTSRRMGALGAIWGVRTNGEEFPIEASISKVEIGGRKLFTVILRDITDRKKAEERVARFATVLDESINELYFFDVKTWKFIEVNRSARENLGYSMEELQLLTPVDLIPELNEKSFANLINPLLTRERGKIEFAVMHQRKDGSRYPVEVYLQLVPFEDSRIFLAIVLDTTERTMAQEAFKESQRTLTTLMSNLPGMAYRCRNDREWTMEFVSQECMDLTGYTAEDLVDNQTVSYGRDLIHQEDREQVWQVIQKALQHKRRFEVFYRLRIANGTEKWVWEQGCGVFSQTGDLLKVEGFVLDITEQKVLEAQLRRTERLAELGTLASGMAHEIGTPMNVILGRAEYLMRKTSDEQTKKGLATIISQVERITKIMNQLLSFARKRPIDRRPLELEGVIYDILDVVQDRLDRRNIKLETALPSPIPKVFADRDQMGQVLLNLVMNAIQAMPEGGTLRITVEVAAPWVSMSVMDTGCGIAQENLPKLFTPFFTTKEVGEGTGLGLTVVHGIVQDHDGLIHVQSELQKGTTFCVSLPVFDPVKHGS